MSKPPNVLLVCTDHWPGSYMACAGHPVLSTPTLDQLARNGVRFTQAYSECPVCVPARRSLYTGMSPRGHGDRLFNEMTPWPADAPFLAQCFRDAGYEAKAVGKMHVYPQRQRMGFDDVLLCESGRIQFGVVDDYALFLGEQGHVGEQYHHGMNNNEYMARPWHLPEALHATNWATNQMARVIKRRDPTVPQFWFLSYSFPHPPLVPPAAYWDLYRDLDPGTPAMADWALDFEHQPYFMHAKRWGRGQGLTPQEIRWARQAFFALCTHIDHQLRVVIGALREERLLNDTIVMFTSDHGDSLGMHGFWGKELFYEDSARVPMLLMWQGEGSRVRHNTTDNRLVAWRDIMPTLLDLAGLPIPETVEGISMVGEARREWLYGEYGEGRRSTRMIHDGRFKLIYYPVGHCIQLFDLHEDPDEMRDLSASPHHAEVRERLVTLLVVELYGDDLRYLRDGTLVGAPNEPFEAPPNHEWSGQRGTHWPLPPSAGR